LQTRLPGHVRIHPYTHDRLAAAAVAVCTFGVTVYELMFLGIPSLVIGHSVGNAEISRILAERCRATVDLGYVGDLSAAGFIEPLSDLLGNQQRRRGLAQAGMERIDGLGAQRTAERIIGLVS
jgi:spore coat polysaccharide biosynthesis predicted glycosyltransferase SpsG